LADDLFCAIFVLGKETDSEIAGFGTIDVASDADYRNFAGAGTLCHSRFRPVSTNIITDPVSTTAVIV